MHRKTCRYVAGWIVLLASMLLVTCSDDDDAKLVTPYLFQEEFVRFNPKPSAGGAVLRWEPDLGATRYKVILRQDQTIRVMYTHACSLVVNLGGSQESVYFRVAAVRPSGKQSRIHDINIESTE